MIKYDLTEAEKKAGKRICIAVDIPKYIKMGSESFAWARQLPEDLGDLVAMFKVGITLHTLACGEGVPIVREMYKGLAGIFLDLKFHDVHDQVYGAARAAAVPGVYMFNLHVSGAEAMCRAALDGATRGAEERGIPRPKVIGVTELTSLDNDDLAKQFGDGKIDYETLVMKRTELAKTWGLDGVVCPASKAGALEQRFGSWLYVTPGIKYGGKAGTAQKQLDTPDGAVQACKSSILVIGTAITGAGDTYQGEGENKKLLGRGTTNDRRQTTYKILQAMAPYV